MRVRVPLVVLTGFLGSGKTTLLNQLLARRAQRGATRKLGVIVNELGEVGIDGALLGGESPRQIELPGGCVCCVLGDELDTTLIELVGANPHLDAIVLETTGVAEPLPIAWAVRREPVERHVRLGAVVTLVDASNFIASQPLSVAVAAQVAYADVVLMTKAELATEPAIREVLDAVRTLAPRALIRRGTAEEHAVWLDQILADPTLETTPSGPEPAAHVHDEYCGHLGTTAGAHGIDSVWVAVSGMVDLEELEDQLADLPDNYVRIKGLVRAVDARRPGGGVPQWFAVHRVGLRVSSEPIAAPEATEGRIVALGPAVEVATLGACVTAALA